MVDEIIKRDENSTTVLAGITDDSSKEIRNILIDPVSGRVKVSAVIASGNISSINALTAPDQLLVVGSGGTDFNIDSTTDTHTFNIPTASATNRGLLSSADWSDFDAKEDLANKDTNTSLGTSNSKYPTQNAVKVYADTGLATKQNSLGFTPEDVANKSTSVTTDGASDTKYPSVKSVKTYVDNNLQGLIWKDPVRVATTTAGTLASSFENGDTIDTVVLATGNRILIKDQADATENGIYTVNASGAPTRSTDADAGSELSHATCLVSEGTANINNIFTCSTTGTITIGVTNINFTTVSGGASGVASAVTFTPAGNITSTNVQDAIEELDTMNTLWSRASTTISPKTTTDRFKILGHSAMGGTAVLNEVGGVATNAVLTMRENVTTDTNPFIGVSSWIDVAVGADSAQNGGSLSGIVKLNDAHTYSGNMNAVYGEVSVESGAIATGLTSGISGSNKIAGTADYATGGIGYLENNGTATDAFGLVGMAVNSGTTTNLSLLAANLASNTGTITNLRGLYIPDLSGIGVTTSYNLLSEGTTSINKFEGNVQILGSIGLTGTRVTKGWFTDLEITNLPTAGGVTIPSISSTSTLTNKRVTPRITTIVSSATPTINTDNCDSVTITALAANITSMTTNLSGTPTNFQKLIVRIKDDGTARTIAWGTKFVAMGVALPTTTVISKILTVGFIYDTVTAKWGCVASNQET